MVSNILRWSAKGLLDLVLLLALVIASFRLTASIRETGTRAELAPRTGDAFKDALLKVLGKL